MPRKLFGGRSRVWAIGMGLAMLGAGSYAAYRRLVHAPLPQTEGTIYGDGLQGRVEILRDSWGIPHIYAGSLADAAWAQGYVHAQDRLWQMELLRRAASGTLSELFGPLTFELDRWIRRAGLRRAAQGDYARMAERERLVLDAYTAGVNTYIADSRKRLPLEFTLLRARPAVWRGIDSMAIGKLNAFSLSNNWPYELMRARLVAQLGPEQAALFEPAAQPYDTILPSGASQEDYRKIHSDLLDIFTQFMPYLGPSEVGASNSWVIGPQRSASGNALLANDPHLALQMPSVWYELHMQAAGQAGSTEPALNVAGGSFPGVPMILIGHNDRIAWGITASAADVQDLYLERRHPDDQSLFEYKGDWERAQVEHEEIRIKGQTAYVEDVVLTRHGPLITPLNLDSVPATDEPIALRWAGHNAAESFKAVLSLNLARNWDEFSTAVADWADPSLNLVYADRDGNIGYRLVGAIPIRKEGSGLLPLPGWTGEYEWDGFIPHNELPAAFNPPEGVIVTANNRIVDREYPYNLGYDWDSGYRAQRINQMINARQKISIDDCRAMQMDNVAIPALQMQPYWQNITTEDQRIRTALDMLLLWDGSMDKDSIAAAIYGVWEQKFQEYVFAPLLGSLREVYFKNALRTKAMRALLNLLQSKQSPSVLGHRDTTWDDLMITALNETLDYLTKRLNPQIEKWRWGDIHHALFSHPLTQHPQTGPLLARIFNRGPVPLSGSGHTVNRAEANVSMNPGDPYRVVNITSLRFIVDMGTPGAAIAMHSTGESGQSASPHYDDMISPWATGKYHQLLFKRDDIVQQSRNCLLILPARTGHS